MSKHGHKIVTGVVIFLAIVAVSSILFFVLYGQQLIAYYQARKLQRDFPELAIMPHPLTDYSINPSEGMTLSRFGYEFELPWKDLSQTKDYRSMTTIFFKSGQAVVFWDPMQQPDSVQLMKQTAEKGGLDIREVFGDDAMSSNYKLREAVLNMTAQDVSPFMPRKDAIRSVIFLTFKPMHVLEKSAKTGFFSLHAPGLRGFQQGDPLRGAPFVLVTAFDEQDHECELEIFVQKGSAAKITQADVNRIVLSLHRALASTSAKDSPGRNSVR